MITISATDPNATEPPASDNGTFLLTRTGDTTQPLSVTLSVSGTAQQDVDYTLNDAFGQVFNSVFFDANVSSVVLTVMPLSDALSEMPETVIVQLVQLPACPYAVGAPSVGTVTITSLHATVTIAIVDSNTDETGNNPGMLRLNRTLAVGALEVDLGFSGTASFGSDYVISGVNELGRATIPDEASTLDLPVLPIPDSRAETLPGETLTVTVPVVVRGESAVDESAITGESAPVIRESGGDRSAVTGGTRVLSDRIVVRITARPGETFLDRMIALVEGAERRKTPNEIALSILLAGLTIVFLLVTLSLQAFAVYSGVQQQVLVLVALLVTLIPTTIGALLSAIGIAGMDRLVGANVLAMSGRAVEAAGDCTTLLLDKTGTITLGDRQAREFVPASGITEAGLAEAAQLASLADETPEGRSIVVLAKGRFGLRGRQLHGATLIPFTAQTRMSGVDVDGRRIRKGAVEAVGTWVAACGGTVPAEVREAAGAAATVSAGAGTIATGGSDNTVGGRRRSEAKPAAYHGKVVILGGVIVEKRVQAGLVWLLMRNRPVDDDFVPHLVVSADTPESGFFWVAVHQEGLPKGYEGWARVTVVGQVSDQVHPDLGVGHGSSNTVLAGMFLRGWGAGWVVRRSVFSPRPPWP